MLRREGTIELTKRTKIWIPEPKPQSKLDILARDFLKALM